MENFWAQLPKPFFALAPMADVTDAAFRRVIARYSGSTGSRQANPFVMYTEFVSADGLARAPRDGRAKLMRDLVFTQAERPIVAQFFTSTPDNMESAAALVQELGFDGVDINMGCPDKSIEKQGAGAKLILNPRLARELVAAAKRGAPALPVSVKTRLGYNKDALEEWLPALLGAEPAAVAIHARTRKEMSAVPARWERVKRAVELRDALGSKTLIVGNGDIKDLADAHKKAVESGADGVMLGRAVFGRPWLFKDDTLEKATPQPGEVSPRVRRRLDILVEHTKAFEELLGDIKPFAIMKKHFKAYVEGFPGARELRMELMEAANAAEVGHKIDEFIKTHGRAIL